MKMPTYPFMFAILFIACGNQNLLDANLVLSSAIIGKSSDTTINFENHENKRAILLIQRNRFCVYRQAHQQFF
jgi:hypothetical protein